MTNVIIMIKFDKVELNANEKSCMLQITDKKIDSLNAPSLKSEFVFLRNEGIMSLILDVSEVTYIDSIGLSAILTGNRLFKPSDYNIGTLIVLTGIGINNPDVEKLITISRLETVMKIIPDVQKAKEYVLSKKHLQNDYEEK